MSKAKYILPIRSGSFNRESVKKNGNVSNHLKRVQSVYRLSTIPINIPMVFFREIAK